ncbi:hypothetical protein D0Z00_000752 [Geotrichum galactomycetum]|uniref:Uncharacterized protein n=1 Tax=Geotrichum galactomycetum TaxID=27317 RepID=A0ACB6V910_9ASCO|nr:hypothetical protein D0Z00_000752 [Geotrichum candidum]
MPRITVFRTITLTALLLFVVGSIMLMSPLLNLASLSQNKDFALKLIYDNLESLAPVSLAGAPHKKLTHLVLVPCHSVWIGDSAITDPKHLGEHDSEWAIGPKSRFLLGRTKTLKEHIKAAADIARPDPKALLIFSGGQTSVSSGPLSESQSYWQLAKHLEELIIDTEGNSLEERTVVEEYARDSFENLLFSLARFREYTGRYPTKITVVGYSFKEARFRELHRAAIKYPADRFHYVGIDPPDLDQAAAAQGERENAYLPFQADPFGCHDKVLQEKRILRNPYRRTPFYVFSAPEMFDLLAYCDKNLHVFKKLPWASTPRVAAATTTNKKPSDSEAELADKKEDNDKQEQTSEEQETSPAVPSS